MSHGHQITVRTPTGWVILEWQLYPGTATTVYNQGHWVAIAQWNEKP